MNRERVKMLFDVGLNLELVKRMMRVCPDLDRDGLAAKAATLHFELNDLNATYAEYDEARRQVFAALHPVEVSELFSLPEGVTG